MILQCWNHFDSLVIEPVSYNVTFLQKKCENTFRKWSFSGSKWNIFGCINYGVVLGKFEWMILMTFKVVNHIYKQYLYKVWCMSEAICQKFVKSSIYTQISYFIYHLMILRVKVTILIWWFPMFYKQRPWSSYVNSLKYASRNHRITPNRSLMRYFTSKDPAVKLPSLEPFSAMIKTN